VKKFLILLKKKLNLDIVKRTEKHNVTMVSMGLCIMDHSLIPMQIEHHAKCVCLYSLCIPIQRNS